MRAKRKALRRADDLLAAGLIPLERRAAIEAVAARYALALTADIAELIDTADAHDPIARQFVPDDAELESRPEEMADPIGDDAHSPVKGIVHRYPDRVLLKPVHVCAAYCRFCFRREAVGRARPLSRAQLEDRRGLFDVTYRRFFFVDKYPEIADRFDGMLLGATGDEYDEYDEPDVDSGERPANWTAAERCSSCIRRASARR